VARQQRHGEGQRGIAAPNGLFFANLQCTMADISDGTSNTAAFSEHVIGDFNNAIATEKADTFWPQTYPAKRTRPSGSAATSTGAT
jgi:hypothetical protein